MFPNFLSNVTVLSTHLKSLMHSHVCNPVVPMHIDSQTMWHVEHVFTPTGLYGTGFGIQHINGFLLNRTIFDQIEYIAVIKSATITKKKTPTQKNMFRNYYKCTHTHIYTHKKLIIVTAVDLLSIPISVGAMEDDRIALWIYRHGCDLSEGVAFGGPVLH